MHALPQIMNPTRDGVFAFLRAAATVTIENADRRLREERPIEVEDRTDQETCSTIASVPASRALPS